MGRPGIRPLIARIKRINARFRSLKDKDGPLADRLRDAKDKLIDALAARCPHPRVIAARGRRAADGRPSIPPLRLCLRCGFCESPAGGEPFVTLTGPRTDLRFEDYLVLQGRALKRLGINV